MIQIEQDSELATFEQVREQIVALRTSGELAAGSRLPTVRQLASQLGIAPNTVARAYRELEQTGAIETRGRNGSFVVGTPESAKKAARAAASRFLSEVHALGLSDQDATKALRKAIKAASQAPEAS